MEIRNYKEALDYLDSFITPVVFEKIENPSFDPLERMRTLLKLLGNPEKKFKSIVVSGTSGKGSTAYFTSHILKTAGYKTGFTLSPHLQKVNERLQINGRSISDKDFIRLVTLMIHIIRVMEKMSVGKPSYFEILLAMAFLYFAEQKVDIAVVEVGLEGKYDATNVLLPLLVVLTNISLDHTQILGDTVEKIAAEAVHAIKELNDEEKTIVISGVKQKSVIKIVEERCRETNARLLLLGKDFEFKEKSSSLKGSVFIFKNKVFSFDNFRLSMIGKFQLENASMAIEAVLNLKKFGYKISENHIRKALKTAFFAGRFEVLKCHPELISGSPANRQVSLRKNKMLNSSKRTFLGGGGAVQHDKGVTLILDGAHNDAKMKAFLGSLEKLYKGKRKVFIIGFKFDKEIKKMLKGIVNVADEIIVTEFGRATDTNLNASFPARNLKSLILNLKSNAKVIVKKDSEKALKKAIKMQPEIIVVTGSLYLVGEIRDLLF